MPDKAFIELIQGAGATATLISCSVSNTTYFTGEIEQKSQRFLMAHASRMVEIKLWLASGVQMTADLILNMRLGDVSFQDVHQIDDRLVKEGQLCIPPSLTTDDTPVSFTFTEAQLTNDDLMVGMLDESSPLEFYLDIVLGKLLREIKENPNGELAVGINKAISEQFAH